MILAINNGKAKSFVRVSSSADRNGIQQALDLGAEGILVPYVNNRKEVEEAVSCCYYPTQGTRSVYFPQPSTNEKGLLGYVGGHNKNAIVALQVETKSCIDNIEDIVSVPGVSVAFLGMNDLCLSMGLFEKYTFPHMYTSPELMGAIDKMLAACAKHNVIPGLFLFGTARVEEFVKKGFKLISIGNDLHHILTTATNWIKECEGISKDAGHPWTHIPSAML